MTGVVERHVSARVFDKAYSLQTTAEYARTFWIITVSLIVGVEIAAALSGGDANWDFRNYHLYNAFALFNKPFGVDIAPAHMQTFFVPTLDILPYALMRTITWTPALNLALGLPQAIAVALTFGLACRLIRPTSVLEQVAIGLFVVVSATGVAGSMTIATTSNEMLPCALILWALLLLIPPDLIARPTLSRLFWAGILVGSACGLKLTMSYVAITMAIVLILIPRSSLLEIVTRPALFGIGGLLGAVAFSGYWWVHQWMHYGNPVFPMMNNIFRSPFAVAESFVDPTFLPHSIGQALQAPWVWALQLSWATGESRLRDPRFSLAVLACLLCLVQFATRRPRWSPWPHVFITGLFILAFALWRVQFSIYRYLSILELLTGPMMALAIMPVARRFASPVGLVASAGGLLAACLVITVCPQLYRSPAGTPPLAVELGPLAPDSLVLLLDNEPMAYLAAFADPRVRFIGTNDFFMTLDGSNPLQAEVEAAIKGHRGPIWGLDSPPEQKDRSDQTLAHYNLVRHQCRSIPTNVSPLDIRLCRLERRQLSLN